jgi:hypothetical protein
LHFQLLASFSGVISARSLETVELLVSQLAEGAYILMPITFFLILSVIQPDGWFHWFVRYWHWATI